MPRRYYDYVEVFHGGNIISSFGAIIMIAGLAIIIINLVKSAISGKKA
jgi:cytochrome c oxidase subunit I